MNWRSGRLRDFVILKRGYDLPSDARKDGDVPIVSSSGITGFHDTAKVSAPGVVTGRYGTIGKVFFITKDYWPLNTSLYVQDYRGNDARFVAYFLRNLKLDKLVATAAVPGINRNVLHELPASFPPLEVQQTIAVILSAYDDLIENNKRRIALLEESARLLYGEWFVHLRFSGHEHVRIVDGVPEGWERKSIGDVAESIRYGYTASATDEAIGPKFLRITDIVPSVLDWSGVPYCDIPPEQKHKYLLEEGDIVIARTGATTGYAKRIGRYHPEAVFASYLVRIRLSNELDDCIGGLFVESSGYKTFILGNAGGAAQPNANAQILSSATLLIPPKNIQRLFREYVEPILLQRDVLQRGIVKLRQARDLLLPRLMNGEIAV